MSTVTQTGAPSRARILLVAVFTVLAMFLTVVAPQGARAETTVTYAQMMQRVVDDTNAVRAEVGLPPLVRDAGLDSVAAAWSFQQWTTGVMSHNPSFSVQIASGWLRAGENVAKGYTYTQVVPAWKASPTHYANMVNDYTSIGIGYFEQDGRRYWTQLFAKYPGVVPPAPTSVAPVNTVAPTVSGASAVGTTWSSTTGTWTGAPTPTYQRTWLRCSQAVTTTYSAIPTGCTAISGATAATYVSTTADVGKYLTVLVTASNSAGSAKAGARTTVATTATTTPVAPVNTVAPTVAGSSSVGSTWTSTTGTWAGTPAPTFQRTWLRCTLPVLTAYSATPLGCAAISGATGATYVSTSADVGKYLTVLVTATNSAGSAKAGARTTVATTGTVVAVGPLNIAAPTVSGSSSVGSTWTSTTGTWTGAPAPTYQRTWLRCTQPVTTSYSAIPTGCTAITGATATSYVSTSSDVGKYLTVLVTATNSAGTTKAGARTTVATTAAVTPAAPVNTVAPTVSGASAVGSTWTSTTGTWTGTPAPTFQRVWLRCNQPLTSAYSAIPAGCAQISGATAATYVSTSSDVGKYLTVFVTATNSAGTAKAGARTTVATG
ncbi:CAP domain-containing protein [Pseudolysinimonas yzui]|uniref:SCP domain-containing protein n=1 Tax=Pseudolysinimonas yzui TaxID=2708254 RepID=A0A8J3GQ89_9MICO|nr:CAP domain-containing protein [Pseudolysinimonas yzui]GHF14024.1 hypothetical protein GCM10011600_13690 [Pseudolysinimonas yzui]